MAEYVFRGKVFSVKVEEVKLPSGVKALKEVVEHPGAVVILPFKDGKLIMVVQYRAAVGEWLLELPAGTLEEGENPYQCALRELEEETGFRASKLEKLFEMYLAPGYSTEKMHVFVAKDLTPSKVKLEKDEVINVKEISFSEALNMVRDGVIKDAKTISTLLYAKAFLQQRYQLG
ncbi:MAG: hypothetical protein DRJ31_01585 [Candidatus Methanomethylicota archaeon]|uniref:Nudix hydrolase domain-containing protein n=1 Tax=Thermoproteota archaeon TaxID=2056631 RepID=A0A497ET47_9CREN|nr:MAG: hypothetical protein DRJ31_01585 [Candidatus Verstraetearchaeota archaeon]